MEVIFREDEEVGDDLDEDEVDDVDDEDEEGEEEEVVDEDEDSGAVVRGGRGVDTALDPLGHHRRESFSAPQSSTHTTTTSGSPSLRVLCLQFLDTHLPHFVVTEDSCLNVWLAHCVSSRGSTVDSSLSPAHPFSPPSSPS